MSILRLLVEHTFDEVVLGDLMRKFRKVLGRRQFCEKLGGIVARGICDHVFGTSRDGDDCGVRPWFFYISDDLVLANCFVTPFFDSVFSDLVNPSMVVPRTVP